MTFRLVSERRKICAWAQNERELNSSSFGWWSYLDESIGVMSILENLIIFNIFKPKIQFPRNKVLLKHLKVINQS